MMFYSSSCLKFRVLKKKQIWRTKYEKRNVRNFVTVLVAKVVTLFFRLLSYVVAVIFQVFFPFKKKLTIRL